jgi:hypothetical protein
MNQAIITCTSTTRPNAIQDGMTIWETDTQSERVLDLSTGQWNFLRGLNIFARKASDQSLTSNTTMTDDNAISVTVPIQSVYIIDLFLVYQSPTAADIKFTLVGPSGSTINWAPYSPDTSQTDFDHTTIDIGNYVAGDAVSAAGFGSNVAVRIRGILITTTTSGTFKLQWAQQTSNGTATIMRTDTWLYLRKVG